MQLRLDSKSERRIGETMRGCEERVITICSSSNESHETKYEIYDVENRETKRLNCSCYIGGERRLLRDGTFRYVGGIYGTFLIEDDVSFGELLRRISVCLNTFSWYDKVIFCNTRRDKTMYLRVESDDKNGVKMLFDLNEDEVDLFVADPIMIEPENEELSNNTPLHQAANRGNSFNAEDDEEYSKYTDLYHAAIRGNWEVAEPLFDKDRGSLIAPINKLSETALHVSISAGNHSPKLISFVENLVEKMSKEELETRDLHHATALHNAAWVGNLQAAKALVEKHKELLYKSDKRGFLPLHLAAMNAHRDTLEYLLHQIESDEVTGYQLLPEVDSRSNFLILVIGSGFYDIALDLIRKYPILAMSRRYTGDCALQAIGRKVSAFKSGCHHNFWQRMIYAVPCIEGIHKQKKMHVQARDLVNRLCGVIKSSIYSNAYEHYARGALHEAARFGIDEVIEEIVSSFPSLMWAQDWDERNFFERAVIERHENVFNLFYQMTEHKQTILGNKDRKKNNILHLAGRLAPQNKLTQVSGAALQMQRELQWFKEIEKLVNPGDKEWRNDANETPSMVFTKAHKDLVKDGEKWMRNTANSCTIAATLIGTVAFAAAITVPGGENDQGFPVFSKDLAFTIFAISDAISMFTSTTSLLMFLSMLTSRYREDDFLFALPNRLIIGLVTLFLSITTMVVAFSSALYLVHLFGSNHARIIGPVIGFACLPIISFATLQFPLLVDLVATTYGSGIFNKKRNRLPFH